MKSGRWQSRAARTRAGFLGLLQLCGTFHHGKQCATYDVRSRANFLARSASAMEGNASRTLLVSSLLITVEDSTKYSSLYIPKLLHICRENVSAISGSVSVVMLYSLT